jgi:hypothetical protein
MKQATLLVIAAGVFVLAGCNSDPGSVAGAVPVQGKVTFPAGRSAKDLVVRFFPVDSTGRAVGMRLSPDGSFRGEAIPGKYSWFLSAVNDDPRAAAAIPAKYRDTDRDRTTQVGSSDLQLKVE